jgi:hypothetical protein
LLYALPGQPMPEKFCRSDDGDAIVVAEGEEVLAVAGDDQVGAALDRTFEHPIVRFLRHDNRQTDRENDELGDLADLGPRSRGILVEITELKQRSVDLIDQC